MLEASSRADDRVAGSAANQTQKAASRAADCIAPADQAPPAKPAADGATGSAAGQGQQRGTRAADVSAGLAGAQVPEPAGESAGGAAASASAAHQVQQPVSRAADDASGSAAEQAQEAGSRAADRTQALVSRPADSDAGSAAEQAQAAVREAAEGSAACAADETQDVAAWAADKPRSESSGFYIPITAADSDGAQTDLLGHQSCHRMIKQLSQASLKHLGSTSPYRGCPEPAVLLLPASPHICEES